MSEKTRAVVPLGKGQLIVTFNYLRFGAVLLALSLFFLLFSVGGESKNILEAFGIVAILSVCGVLFYWGVSKDWLEIWKLDADGFLEDNLSEKRG